MSLKNKIYLLYLLIRVNLAISLGLAFVTYSLVSNQEAIRDRLDVYYVLIDALYGDNGPCL